MRFLATLVLARLTFISGCGDNAGQSQPPRVLELPRPNSGTFSFEHAGAKKHLILFLRVRQKPGLKGTSGEDADPREARTTYAGQVVRFHELPVAATVPAGGIVDGRIRGFCVIRGSEM
jgi:hypothetical protein